MPVPVILAAGAAALRGGALAATLAPLVRPAIRAAVGLIKRKVRPGVGTARPGPGSPVRQGPLMVGKQRVFGPSRPGSGTVIGAGAAAAVGVGTVASHRRAARPATQTQPSPRRSPTPRATSTGTRKCCPVGTRRMVCFKRGRVKPRKKSARKAGTASAAQKRARAKFAAAARRGKIRKGARL